MIRFCSSGTSAAPISTPRSPRATITRRLGETSSIASAADRLAPSRSSRSRTRPRARRLDERSRSARRRRRERTNESATKSTSELERELEVARGPCVGERRDRQRDAGQVDALVRRDRRRRPRRAAARAAASTASTRSRTSPSSISTCVARAQHRAEHVGADRQLVVARRVLARDRRPRRRARARRGCVETRRSAASGPGGRRSARSDARGGLCASRTQPHAPAWSSCVPCEKLRRAPSMPASTSRSIASGVDEAGPIVRDDLRAAHGWTLMR